MSDTWEAAEAAYEKQQARDDQMQGWLEREAQEQEKNIIDNFCINDWYLELDKNDMEEVRDMIRAATAEGMTSDYVSLVIGRMITKKIFKLIKKQAWLEAEHKWGKIPEYDS